MQVRSLFRIAISAAAFAAAISASNGDAYATSQPVILPRAFSGLVWSPDGTKFYVAGGPDDNVHTYAQVNGQWAESGTPISLGHKGNVMNQETGVAPTVAGIGITFDGSTVVVANWETDSITAVDVVNRVVLAEYDLRPGIIDPAQSG